MISQPTNIIPSTLSGLGDGVIDVTDGLTVKWQFSGNPMVSYRLDIYKNDTASTAMYDTGKVDLAEPFYPIDSKGNVQTFTATEITAATLSTAGIVNGYANGYKIKITMWENADDYVEQYSQSVFITRSAPTLAIDAITSPYAGRTIDITATYTQAQGDTLSWVEWFLRNDEDPDTILVDTGFLYTNSLGLFYDGLLSDNTYSVRLIVQTENGVQVDTGWVSFDVSYTTVSSEGLVNVCRPLNAPYVQVSWINRTVVEGWLNEGYSATYGDGLLRLPASAVATWDGTDDQTLAFAKPWSFAWRGQRTDITGGLDVWELQTSGDSYKFNITSTTATLTHGADTLYTRNITLKPNDWLVCALTPTHFYFKQVTYSGGLYPATDLYPDSSLYPQPISNTINVWDAAITDTQDSVTGIVLNGQQNCDYIWLYSDTFEATTIDNLMGNTWYEPQYDAQTFLIATFENEDLIADVNGGNGDSLYGASIYRKEGSEKLLRHIADISKDYVVFRDYGVKSRTQYVYYIFMRGMETYVSAPYVSEQITPQFRTYSLMECELQDDGYYHVLQSFLVAGNISTGSISNNGSVSVLQNFTQYPIRQATSLNYKSGTLSALIGDCSNNSYSDNWELANRIMALSTSTNPKFLRDAKGALWMIETNGAVTMSVNDKSAVLPIQMSFPWVEVGDASTASIIALPTDDVWEKDMLYTTSIDIDETDGCLYWGMPDDYTGSQLMLNGEGNLLEVGDGFMEVANAYITQDGYLFASV